MAVVHGTVSMSVTKERVPKATVEARKGTETKHKVADDLGTFAFADLEEGKWSFVALDTEHVPGRTKTLKVPGDTDKGVWLNVQRKETAEDRRSGKIFFGGLLVAFALLVLVYLGLHLWVQQGSESLSETTLVALDILEEQADAAFEAQDKAAAGAALLAAIEDIGDDVETALGEREDLTKTDKLIMTKRVNDVKGLLAKDKAAQTLDAKKYSELPAKLAVLRAMIKSPRREAGIWNRDPLRSIEVLLWALAGILVRKIIMTGWYLRRRSFQKDGLIMHISHLVATPVMVLVVIYLLSLVSLEITLAAGNALTLDLSDPRIMVAFSFLLGTIPWPLWNFITGTAEKFPSGIG